MSYLLDSEKQISENSGGLGCNQVDTRLDQARHTHVVQLFLLHDLAHMYLFAFKRLEYSTGTRAVQRKSKSASCVISAGSPYRVASKQAGCREREVGHDSRAKDVPSITMPTLSKTVALLLLVQPATSSLLPTTDLLAQANVAVSSTDAIACACQRHEPTTTLVTNAFLITFLLLVNRGR